MTRRPLHFRARLTTTRRSALGVVLPAGSLEWLGTRAQVRVEAIVNGAAFTTTAFPARDGTHVVLVSAALRRKLGVGQGDTVDVELRRAGPRPIPRMSAEVRALLSSSEEGWSAWESLTPAARRVALTWIEGARSAEIRRWRVADVLRRAKRYQEGKGPFYPTADDQALLARPRDPLR